ncbi:MAG: NAD(+)/NADH kinase, partial [Chloroflexi bacterium]|nr:NAD(+)/NADH kinase [Chloroflexota bacterium]
AVAKLPEVLAGAGWIEERTMVQATVLSGGEGRPGLPIHHGLNEVTVSRASPARPVYVSVHIDGQYLATYRADGVIISTATGSTAYNLAAGGPIMHPTAQSLILKPVAPHMGLPNSLVLPPEVSVSLVVGTDNEAIMSVDGQLDLRLANGDTVLVKRSPHVARFLRIRPRTYFYATLVAKLGYTARANGYPDSGSSPNPEDRSR